MQGATGVEKGCEWILKTLQRWHGGRSLRFVPWGDASQPTTRCSTKLSGWTRCMTGPSGPATAGAARTASRRATGMRLFSGEQHLQREFEQITYNAHLVYGVYISNLMVFLGSALALLLGDRFEKDVYVEVRCLDSPFYLTWRSDDRAQFSGDPKAAAQRSVSLSRAWRSSRATVQSSIHRSLNYSVSAVRL